MDKQRLSLSLVVLVSSQVDVEVCLIGKLSPKFYLSVNSLNPVLAFILDILIKIYYIIKSVLKRVSIFTLETSNSHINRKKEKNRVHKQIQFKNKLKKIEIKVHLERNT